MFKTLENTYFSRYSRLFSCRVLAFKHIFQSFTSIYMFFLSEDRDSFYKLTYILDFYSYLYVNLSNLDSFYCELAELSPFSPALGHGAAGAGEACEWPPRERRLKAGKMLRRSILSESPSSSAAKACEAWVAER